MSSQTTLQGKRWTDTARPGCPAEQPDAEAILRSINRTFDQVNLATEFFLLREDPGSPGPELQLACVIKDRIARLEEQVSALYRALSRPPSAAPARTPVLTH